MSDIVISVENVSKLYRLGTTTKVATLVVSSGTLSHDVNRAWARQARPARQNWTGERSTFKRWNVATF